MEAEQLSHKAGSDSALLYAWATLEKARNRDLDDDGKVFLHLAADNLATYLARVMPAELERFKADLEGI